MIDVLKKLLTLLPATDKYKLLGLFLMMVLASLLEVIGIGMIPVFVSIVAQPEQILELPWLSPLFEALEISDSGDLLVYGSVAIIILYIIKNLFLLYYRYVESYFVWRRFSLIGSNLFKEYLNAPYEFILGRNTSVLLRNVTQEAQYLAANVMVPYLKLSMDFILMVSILTLLIIREPFITFVVVGLLGFSGGLFLKLVKEKIKEYGKSAQEDRGLMIKLVNEGMGGLKDIRVLNREDWFHKRFRFRIKNFADSQAFRAFASTSPKPIIETFAVAGIMIIALILYMQGRGIDLVIPILALFGAALLRLMPAIRESATLLTNLKYYSYTIYPIYNDIQELGHSERLKNGLDKEKKQAVIRLNNDIQFHDLSYTYEGSDQKAIDGLNLSINKGQAVGFIGTSGAGKTTLVDILLGLLTPQQGRITVDSVNIETNISSWQKDIGYIPQIIFLADDSIRNNIAFGISEEHIDSNKLSAAVEASQLDDLIESLPNGLDTIIGERGIRISGGQRQRIGIARALYHNPGVLVMDEATSALDNVTEKFVIQAIEKLKGERTIVMIAHRLSTVRNCDQLFFMEKGRVIDRGTYTELLARNQAFKKMALVDE